MKIKIEKNIPLIRKTKKPKGCKYDFLYKLEVSDSFLYPFSKENKRRLYEASWKRKIKLSIRVVEEERMTWENKTCSNVMRVLRVK